MKDIYQQLHIVDGNRHTALSREEGEFLYRFVRDRKFIKTLEIGLAYGVSTAYIMTATNSIHYAIDPFQNSEKYDRAGLKNIEKLGLKKNLKYIEDFSCLALPSLCNKNFKFEFVFVDGSHKFDDQFVDFYFIDLLLAVEGVVIFHDVWTPQVRTLLSWIETNKKCYHKVDIENESFVIIEKIKNDDRKWFDFKRFAVTVDGNVSRYM